ncbi:MAG TPA: zinc ribbon domain-containing protein [Planctomycetota bacterium]|nr:zinc ribbon domain-containing protein [Planctomycetota bacterium]
MPHYPYACNACGHRFETFQKMNDPKLKDCPECKKPQLERLIVGGTGHVMKGGFHGEKGLDYKEKSRAEIAVKDPEKFDRILEKDRKAGNLGKDPLRPPSE